MKPLSELRPGDEVAIVTQGCLGKHAKVATVKAATPEFVEVDFRQWIVKFPLDGSLVQDTSEYWLSTDPALIARIKAVPGLRGILILVGSEYPPPAESASSYVRRRSEALGKIALQRIDPLSASDVRLGGAGDERR